FWLFHRRLVYQGWPIITSDDYLAQGEDFWQSQGIEDFYFFKIIDPKMLLRPPEEKSDSSHVLQKELSGLTPEIIKRPDGREVFAVYYWQNHNE
ncbi:hypothetical protein HYZ76_02045, partial [Candidatus Falkowbacteria bacterium]|nr:hypothetical protein [Candidatus Falkowbacteria bacterium]